MPAKLAINKNPDFAAFIAWRDKAEVYDWIQAQAEKEGVGVSDFLRQLVRDRMRIDGVIIT